MKPLTQLDRVLRHLNDFGSISQWESITEYGITRLSAIIFILKHEHYPITSEWIHSTNRYGEKSRYKKYYLDNMGA